MSGPVTLSQARLVEGVSWLTGRDPDLAAIVAQRGLPPLWAREPGFPTLLHIILEQQVSLASARAAFVRVQELASPLTPESFLTLDDAALKAAGFSRQKMAYGRGLARDLVVGALDLDALARMNDADAFARLVALHGIGRWSANIYLLMALLRADVWPVGDLALAVAAQWVKRLDTRPDDHALEALALPWAPWRAVAARILWSEYLARQNARKVQA